MTRHPVRALARILRTLAASGLAAFLLMGGEPLQAHEGHDHAEEPQARAGVVASPRVVAESEAYQFVGIVEGEVLVVYVDRAADNAPVTKAQVEVALNGEPFKAEPVKNGTYEVTAPILRTPGQLEVLVTIAEGGASDLLVGSLTIPSGGRDRDEPAAGWWSRFFSPAGQATADTGSKGKLESLGSQGWLMWSGIAAALLVAGAFGLRKRGRAHVLPFLAALSVVALAADAVAHEGHDHGADIKASSGNGPQRRPDGTIFLPKPSQRLLEVRTAALAPRTATKNVRLAGRVAANPNFSGVVQSTIAGRYEAPSGGVPPLGAEVKAGDLLGRVAPSFASIDSSDMAQTMGDIEQRLSIVRAKLARQEQLLRTNVVAPAVVDETRLEVEGLVKRRADLLAARARPEDLRAPVSGVIAVTRVVSGQVVDQNDKLFEIVDPARVLVEALVFDQADPDAITEASAHVAGATVKLRLLGRSRALQHQYTLMQFEVTDGAVPLSVGMPVTVVAKTGAPVSGIFVPRAALAQAPNGQTVVFEHREPEVFVPRPVRTEAFDSETVLVTGGVEAGTKIVVRNALLVNQVR